MPADDHKPGNMADIAKAMVSAGYEGRDALHLWLKSIWLMTDTIILIDLLEFGFFITILKAKTPTPLPARLKASAAAAMKVGDVVLSIDGESAWQDAEPGPRKLGDVSSITVLRNGSELDLELALGVVNPRFVKADWLVGINGSSRRGLG